MNDVTLICGDAAEELKKLPVESVNCCVTSPPYYGLRDYGVDGQIGLEGTPEEYVNRLVEVFREVRRVLRNDGTLWCNLGDSYNGSGGPGSQYDTKAANGYKGEFKKFDNPNRKIGGLKSKDLIGIPWMVAFALRSDGWWLRSDIIWSKPNPMPESVTDRPTRAHEYIFLLSKSAQYYYDNEAILEKSIWASIDKRFITGTTSGGKAATGLYKIDKAGAYRDDAMRNRRSVWNVPTHPFKDAHFATFPIKLIEPCILAGCPKGGIVLDPFSGAGSCGVASVKHGRNYIGIDLNPEYIEMSRKRISAAQQQMRMEFE